jgi:hypothetical protein
MHNPTCRSSGRHCQIFVPPHEPTVRATSTLLDVLPA